MLLKGRTLPKPSAYNLTRTATHYRHEVFSAGLRAAGFDVRSAMPGSVKPGDALLIWNRYGQYHEIATRCEKAGATIIVAENGYLGTDETGQQRYALARHAHNGAGSWPVGSPERWRGLGVNLEPWRTAGGHVLIAPNRSFGTPGRIMPLTWAEDVRRRLAMLTKREIMIRPHPGNNVPKRPLADDLRGAWAVVIWASSAGVHALVAGIPVICCAPAWIAKEAAGHDLAAIENPSMPERLPVFERLAWAQFSLREIEGGEPFRRILGSDKQNRAA